MRLSARTILAIPLLMLATACASWSDFVARLEQSADDPATRPVAEETALAEPLPTLARVYGKAGEKALERGDEETARRFFDKAAELAPGLAPRTADRLAAKRETAAAIGTSASSPTQAKAATAGGLDMRATELVRLYEQPAAGADEATSLHRHAISHDFFGHHALAQQAYRRALAVAPDDIAIRNNLALSLTLSGAYGDAVREMSHVTATSRATARHRHTLDMLLRLAFQQENDLKRLQAARETWRESEQPRARRETPGPATPPELDRIAPSAGTPPGGASDAGTHRTGGEAPDPVAWMVRTVSSMWSRLSRTLAASQPSAAD